MQRADTKRKGSAGNMRDGRPRSASYQVATARLLAEINTRLAEAEKRADENLAALKAMAAAKQ